MRAIFLLALLPSCGGDPPPTVAPELVSTSVDGAADEISPTEAITLAFSTALDAATVNATTILVVEGAADGALLRQLDGGTIGDAARARLAPGGVALDGPTSARFEPERPLAPSMLHTLVVTTAVSAGGARMARAATRPFTTGPVGSGAPTWQLDDPPAGAAGVVRNLRAVDVAFSRPVNGVGATSLTLASDGDPPIAAAVRPLADDRMRFRLTLAALLDAGRDYRVLASPAVTDDDGEPPFPSRAPPAFATGSTVRDAPPAIAGAATIASSGCLVARFTTDVAATGMLCVGGDCVEEVDRRTQHELSRPLAPGGAASFTLAARDESTAPAASQGPLPAPASSPRPIAVTEVLAHPRGAWPTQQFIEIENRGAAPVAVGGLVLRGENGADDLPDASLEPAHYAVIVPSDFLVDDGLDPPVARGAIVLRIDRKRFFGHGIRESGEAVGLYESDGRPVSLFATGGQKTTAGQSVRRVGSCDVAGAYEPTPGGGSTPGGP